MKKLLKMILNFFRRIFGYGRENIEIERKFLIDKSKLVFPSDGKRMIQGYLPSSNNTVMRIRLVYGEKALLTIKSEAIGITRKEYEYQIPPADADEMLYTICSQNFIDKTRYLIGRWEVDVFHKDNEGLIVAEIELESEDEKIDLPAWVTEEVTHDTRYLNCNLENNPYKNWKE